MTAAPAYERHSPSNRSVERALLILRAFRPGVSALGNADIAEATGLARSTVSRLTQTLVECGFLDYDFARKAYRLGPPVLSLAHALRLDSQVLHIALPLMQEIAEGHRINVGLAMADQTDMVYLESVRRNRSGLFRHVTSGSRVPIELTSLGRAYLSTLPAAERRALLAELSRRHPSNWKAVKQEIDEALAMLAREGFCIAAWQVGITSIAVPLRLANGPTFVFNISFASQDYTRPELEKRLVPLLRTLLARVTEALARLVVED
ncbi:IclR family transcriptional regulator [Pseudomonas sp. A014]|uniref:IclR family transcriptional regulator n=1 Tax=Pseudomonas sp. A014 TaxID=3458058 RepID=UPI004035D3EA